MLHTHPDRKHKPPHPRAGRYYRRNFSGSGGRGTGASPWGVAGTSSKFRVGGNAFFPVAGTAASSYAHGSGGQGRGNADRFPGGGETTGGSADIRTETEGDETLVEPGKVFFTQNKQNKSSGRTYESQSRDGFDLKEGQRGERICCCFAGVFLHGSESGI